MVKIVLVLLLCAVFAADCKVKKTTLFLAPELTAYINKAVQGCKQELDDIPEFLKIIREGDYKHDEKFQRFVYCLCSTTGFVDKKGKLIVEKGVALFPDKEAMTKLLQKCNKHTGPNPQATCNLAIECFQNESPYKISFSTNH